METIKTQTLETKTTPRTNGGNVDKGANEAADAINLSVNHERVSKAPFVLIGSISCSEEWDRKAEEKYKEGRERERKKGRKERD